MRGEERREEKRKGEEGRGEAAFGPSHCNHTMAASQVRINLREFEPQSSRLRTQVTCKIFILFEKSNLCQPSN